MAQKYEVSLFYATVFYALASFFEGLSHGFVMLSVETKGSAVEPHSSSL